MDWIWRSVWWAGIVCTEQIQSTLRDGISCETTPAPPVLMQVVPMDPERRERLRYFGFAGIVGVLLLLNLTGVFTTVFGVDTAAILTVLGGYRIFRNSIAALLEGNISADLAICVAVIAA